jgi:hypothetical protein
VAAGKTKPRQGTEHDGKIWQKDVTYITTIITIQCTYIIIIIKTKYTYTTTIITTKCTYIITIIKTQYTYTTTIITTQST